jgi:hypothetical protein
LSFRNEEDSLKSWHFNSHHKSLRQRRSLDEAESDSSEIPANGAFNDVLDDGSDVLNIDDDEVIKLVRNKRNNEQIVEVDDDLVRNRRDATTINCGGNVNTKPRQLNVGCLDESKIDVSPQCNEDGEEGRQKSHKMAAFD